MPPAHPCPQDSTGPVFAQNSFLKDQGGVSGAFRKPFPQNLPTRAGETTGAPCVSSQQSHLCSAFIRCCTSFGVGEGLSPVGSNQRKGSGNAPCLPGLTPELCQTRGWGGGTQYGRSQAKAAHLTSHAPSSPTTHPPQRGPGWWPSQRQGPRGCCLSWGPKGTPGSPSPHSATMAQCRRGAGVS